MDSDAPALEPTPARSSETTDAKIAPIRARLAALDAARDAAEAAGLPERSSTPEADRAFADLSAHAEMDLRFLLGALDGAQPAPTAAQIDACAGEAGALVSRFAGDDGEDPRNLGEDPREVNARALAAAVADAFAARDAALVAATARADAAEREAGAARDENIRLRVLGPDTEVRVACEARALAGAALKPMADAWRAKVEAVEVERDRLRALLDEVRSQWPYPPPTVASKLLRDRIDDALTPTATPTGSPR